MIYLCPMCECVWTTSPSPTRLVGNIFTLPRRYCADCWRVMRR